MLVHKISLGLTFILAVYISALPVVIDKEKDSKKKLRPVRSITAVPTSVAGDTHETVDETDGKEPWEVNENLLRLQGTVARKAFRFLACDPDLHGQILCSNC